MIWVVPDVRDEIWQIALFDFSTLALFYMSMHHATLTKGWSQNEEIEEREMLWRWAWHVQLAGIVA